MWLDGVQVGSGSQYSCECDLGPGTHTVYAELWWVNMNGFGYLVATTTAYRAIYYALGATLSGLDYLAFSNGEPTASPQLVGREISHTSGTQMTEADSTCRALPACSSTA